jgi:hypothetical protein
LSLKAVFRVKRSDQGTDRPTGDSWLKIQSGCAKNSAVHHRI